MSTRSEPIMHDFAGYLHNPYGFPTNIEKAAITVFKRKGRFIGGYDINNDLYNLINKYFGNLELLYENGLVHYYKQIVEEIKEKKLIGLILYGANINNIPQNIQNVNTYTTQDNMSINLTITSICKYILEDYIGSDNIDNLCKETPNFDGYYKTLVNNK
jgi:hypothetical protein